MEMIFRDNNDHMYMPYPEKKATINTTKPHKSPMKMKMFVGVFFSFFICVSIFVYILFSLLSLCHRALFVVKLGRQCDEKEEKKHDNNGSRYNDKGFSLPSDFIFFGNVQIFIYFCFHMYVTRFTVLQYKNRDMIFVTYTHLTLNGTVIGSFALTNDKMAFYCCYVLGKQSDTW